jgi:hypothetical protein
MTAGLHDYEDDRAHELSIFNTSNNDSRRQSAYKNSGFELWCSRDRTAGQQDRGLPNASTHTHMHAYCFLIIELKLI